MAKVGVWADHTQIERLSDYLRTSIWLVQAGALLLPVALGSISLYLSLSAEAYLLFSLHPPAR